MALGAIASWLSGRRAQPAPAMRRTHLASDTWPAAVFAVGDIHGCADELDVLQREIYRRGNEIEGEKWIIYLGDLVDRGPDSAGVIDRLMSRPPEGWKRIPLVGNHEVMFLDYLDNPRSGADWLEFGGDSTLASYGVSANALSRAGSHRRDLLNSHLPSEHVDFLRALPLTLSLPGVLFVHAGIVPGVPLSEQNEGDLLWIRDKFFNATPAPGLFVVHGHTPAAEPVITDSRLCLDTGAFATGRLTAAMLIEGEPPVVFSNIG